MAALRAKSKDSPSVIAAAASSAGKVTGIVGKDGGISEDKEEELVDREGAKLAAAQAEEDLRAMRETERKADGLEQRARALIERLQLQAHLGSSENGKGAYIPAAVAASQSSPFASAIAFELQRECEEAARSLAPSSASSPSLSVTGWRVGVAASLQTTKELAAYATAVIHFNEGAFCDAVDASTRLLLDMNKKQNTAPSKDTQTSLLLPVWLLRGRSLLAIAAACDGGSAGLLLFQLHLDKCFALLCSKPDHEADALAAADVDAPVALKEGTADAPSVPAAPVVLRLSAEYPGIGADSKLNGAGGGGGASPNSSLEDLIVEYRALVAELVSFEGGVTADYRVFGAESPGATNHEDKGADDGHHRCADRHHQHGPGPDHHHHHHHDHCHDNHDHEDGDSCCHHGSDEAASAMRERKKAMRQRLRALKRTVLAALRCWSQIQPLLPSEEANFLLHNQIKRSNIAETLHREGLSFFSEGFYRTAAVKLLCAAAATATTSSDGRPISEAAGATTVEALLQSVLDSRSAGQAGRATTTATTTIASLLLDAACCAAKVPSAPLITLRSSATVSGSDSDDGLSLQPPQAAAFVSLKLLLAGGGVALEEECSTALKACYWLAVAPSSAAESFSLPLAEKVEAVAALVKEASQRFAAANEGGGSASLSTLAEQRRQRADALAELKAVATSCSKPAAAAAAGVESRADSKGQEGDSTRLWRVFGPLWRQW